MVLGLFGGPFAFLAYFSAVQEPMAMENAAEARAAVERIREEHARSGKEFLPAEELSPESEEPSPEEYAKGMESRIGWIGLFLGMGLFVGLLFAPLLSAFAILQIRNSRGRLYGMGLAVFTTFIVPLVLVNVLACSPLSLVSDRSVFGVAMMFAVVMMAILDIWFLVWFTGKMSTA